MTRLSFSASPLKADITEVLTNGMKPVKHEYQAMIHTEKENFPAFKVMSIDVEADYANNVYDRHIIVVRLFLGDYVKRLYPYRTNLEISVKRIVLDEVSDADDPKQKQKVVRYKAFYDPRKNQPVTASQLETMSADDLSRGETIDLVLELVERNYEALRQKTVQGIFRKVTAKKMIHNILGGESVKVTVDGKPTIDALDIVEPDNGDTRLQYVIPSGTYLANLPTFLQEEHGGVYQSGIGTYFQWYKDKKMWFVYPLYGKTRFAKSTDDKLIIYAAPPDRFPSIDRSYKKDGAIIKIVSNRDPQIADDRDFSNMNTGSGFRMMDSRNIMTKPVKITEEGPVGARGNLNFEVVAEDRKDGNNYAPTLMDSSSNPYAQYTKLLARNTARIDLVWENSNPELIYPGMPVRFIYLDYDKVRQVDGIVGFIHSVTTLEATAMNARTYRTISMLSLLAESTSFERKDGETSVPGKFK